MEEGKRRMIIMRHGERLDLALGRVWLEYCFNNNGEYTRRNLNMPKSIPKSKTKQNLRYDPPLSKIGQVQSSMVGDAMKDFGIEISHVYCSPSLRCIETCSNLLKAYGRMDLSVRIEPGLYDLFIKEKQLGEFLTLDEISEWTGLNIDKDYRPCFSRETLKQENNFKLFFGRLYTSLKRTIDDTNSGNILVITHGFTLATNLYLQVQEELPEIEELIALIPYLPYASIVEMIENSKNNQENGKESDDIFKSWQMVENTNLNFSHADRHLFDCHAFHSKILQILGKNKKKNN